MRTRKGGGTGALAAAAAANKAIEAAVRSIFSGCAQVTSSAAPKHNRFD
jgi:hypothetical protein